MRGILGGVAINETSLNHVLASDIHSLLNENLDAIKSTGNRLFQDVIGVESVSYEDITTGVNARTYVITLVERAIVAMPEMILRSDWRRNIPLIQNPPTETWERTGIMIQHTGDFENIAWEDGYDGEGTMAQRVRDLDRAHLGRFSGGIAYHFLIMHDGTIFECRPLNWQGANGDFTLDRTHIAIGLTGNLNFEADNNPTSQQIDSLRDLIVFVMDLFPAITSVIRHPFLNHRRWLNDFVR